MQSATMSIGSINRYRLTPLAFMAEISLKVERRPVVNKLERSTAIGIISLMISGMKYT